MSAYYNEIDLKAAAWLRELIRRNLIAPGEVDERSIAEVRPDDLRGFAQCHFFAGIGGWSYALRLAGWADDRPVWTGSCPCQPFSAAGAGGEFDDARHLWPTWFRLIRECRPVACFGEQVASADALAWLDHVSTDLEGEGYAVGAVDTCAAGFGAPHIRQRLYWVADSDSSRRRTGRTGEARDGRGSARVEPTGLCITDGVADSGSERRQQERRGASGNEAADGREGRNRSEPDRDHVAASGVAACELGVPSRRGLGIERDAAFPRRGGHADGAEQSELVGDAEQPGLQEQRGDGRVPRGAVGTDARETAERAGAPVGPVNGFWRNAEWLPCRDGKARPVEPGTFPLVAGAPARVVRLRGYGNAINAEQARTFIEAYMSI